jgi:HTH-type transcriptional regulator / antitoxin HigA
MTEFRLSQDWVSRVTKSDLPDAPVVGATLSPMPDAGELKSLLGQVSRSEAAREMVRRKWVMPGLGHDKIAARSHALFDFLFAPNVNRPALAMFKGRRVGTQRDLIEEVSTMAWIAHVTDTALSLSVATKFTPSVLNAEFILGLTKLSARHDGPRRALKALREIGIVVVVESGLPSMTVDGASFHSTSIGPVLALTLRHDRLDNFWFTLLHELGHIALHLNDPVDHVYLDDVDEGAGDGQEAEAEADAFAKDGLVPRDTWLRSDAKRLGSEASVLSLAKHLGIHPSIVAGRIRYERREFRTFSKLVGMGGVRDVLFVEP